LASAASSARTQPQKHWTEIDWSPHIREGTILGRRLRYVDYGDPAHPPIVLVHGLGGCWQWWLENIPFLGRHHRVIAVDLPGFGDSEPLPSPGSMSGHVETLRALCDELELGPTVLVGHSMGGLIALLFAREHAERLRGLALVCAGGVTLSENRLRVIVRGFLLYNMWFSRPSVTRAFARRPRLRRLLFKLATGDPRTLSPELGAELIPRLGSAPGFAEAVVQAAGVANLVAPEEIKTPTLLIWGSRDPIVPVRAARELAAQIDGARLEVLDGVGHCPMWERPDEFNQLLGEFAASV
jgi:pimeloyl-ACP methyl ester carboxylesterase